MAHEILILIIAVGAFALLMFFIVCYIESSILRASTYECSRCNKKVDSETQPNCPHCKLPMNIIQ